MQDSGNLSVNIKILIKNNVVRYNVKLKLGIWNNLISKFSFLKDAWFAQKVSKV